MRSTAATEIRRCQAIAAAGTSADAQLAVYEAHRKDESRECALRAVTDWIAERHAAVAAHPPPARRFLWFTGY